MVPTVKTVADIGCDHGKIAVWLVENGVAQTAVCCDLSGPSLDKARRLAEAKGQKERILMREGSGFDVLEQGEVQAAVIAGMGGELIADILDEGGCKVPQYLILSSNKAPWAVRRKLCSMGFLIEDEQLVLERRKYYPVIRAKRGKARTLSDIELELGPVLLEKRPELLKKYVLDLIKQAQRIRDEIKKSKSPEMHVLREMDRRQKNYSEVLKCL